MPLRLRGGFSWQAAAQRVGTEQADPEVPYPDPTWQTVLCVACQLFACPQRCVLSDRTGHKDPAIKYHNSQSQLLSNVCCLDYFQKEISEIQLTENAEIESVIISKQRNKKIQRVVLSQCNRFMLTCFSKFLSINVYSF